MPDSVNAQVVDSVTSTNLKVVGEAPGVALGVAYSALGQCVALTMASATSTQDGMQKIGQSIATVGSMKIMALLNGS